MKNKIPVLLVTFNRPEKTHRVFSKIREYQPEKLFIAADGPRKSNPDDSSLCEETRKIVDLIDWKCEVQTLFQTENLGCRLAVSSAIDWFFDKVEAGIILEDDCLPNRTFFYFCEEMLDKYKNDEKVMHINGTNSQFGHVRGEATYYFSHCPQVWGWATWKRAWKFNDLEMKNLDNFVKSKKAFHLFKNKRVARFWNSLFKHVIKREVSTWAVPWSYSVMNKGGLVITPNVNLVENIGFDKFATHTQVRNDLLKQKANFLGEIKHPLEKKADLKADVFLFQKIYKIDFITKVKLFLKYKK